MFNRFFGKKRKVSEIINEIKPIHNNISISKIGSSSTNRHRQLMDKKFAEQLFIQKVSTSNEDKKNETDKESSSSPLSYSL